MTRFGMSISNVDVRKGGALLLPVRQGSLNLDADGFDQLKTNVASFSVVEETATAGVVSAIGFALDCAKFLSHSRNGDALEDLADVSLTLDLQPAVLEHFTSIVSLPNTA
jgi:hypothetical protein